MSLTLYHDRFRCTGAVDNPPEMLVIHGWGMHSLVWDDVMPALLERFQVTVVDLPGLGRSPIPGGEYTLDYLVEHVLAIAPDRAVWMGWSLGGMVALRAASLHPQRVSALISVASTPKFVADEQWPLAVKPDVLDAFHTMLLEDAEGTLIRFLSLQCKGSDSIKNDIRALKALVNFHGIPAKQALRGGLEILQSVDLRNDLQNLRCPSLHVFGEWDHLIPVGVSEAVSELQPDAQTAVIRGVAHLPFLSAPDLFLAACHDFLREQGLPGGA
ncbi:MAG: pimeloyl-ACP methyl ester esterase BioH [Pseudomonadota bacterium]|nr:pimeloyl-ACP methyl ester esterase BioH [Pseudomonadota bacterium]